MRSRPRWDHPSFESMFYMRLACGLCSTVHDRSVLQSVCKKCGRPLLAQYDLESGYELAEQLDWQLPDVILYPTGGGTGLIGMWKAFGLRVPKAIGDFLILEAIRRSHGTAIAVSDEEMIRISDGNRCGRRGVQFPGRGCLSCSSEEFTEFRMDQNR
jgi:threonine synthase